MSRAVIAHAFILLTTRVSGSVRFIPLSKGGPTVYHCDSRCSSVAGKVGLQEHRLDRIKKVYPNIRACKRCCK